MSKAYRYILVIAACFFIGEKTIAQQVKAVCHEREIKDKDYTYPIIVSTCFFKQFKFVKTSYPDYVGRYIEDECKVLLKKGRRYIACNNTDIFNPKQDSLLKEINKRIQAEFRSLKADSNVNDCLSGIDSIPGYTMNDLQVSLYDNEIWFSVYWGLSGACRAVDGTIVTFKLKDMSRYFKKEYHAKTHR